jgi:2-epi-valiolone-7-phosphate 1-reductase
VNGGDRRLLASPAATARVVRRPRREPEADEIQLRVLRAGLCGTDVQIATGLRSDVATVLGHEGLAIPVDQDGPAVICNPVHLGDQDEILGHSYDGLFQDRVNVGKLDHGGPELCAAAPELVADLAPLVEPLGCVLYSNELLTADVPPRSLMVVGGGTTAALHALVAARRGLDVHLVHSRPERLAWLLDRELTGGAKLHVAGPDLAGRVRAAGAGVPVDAAVLCVPRDGALDALEQALACVREGGVVNLFGGFRSGDQHPMLPGADLGAVRRANVCGVSHDGRHVLAETATGSIVRLTGHRGTSRAHLAEAQRHLIEAPGTFARIVTAVVSLEGLAAVIRMLAKDASVSAERCKIIVDLTLGIGEQRDVNLARRVADVA